MAKIFDKINLLKKTSINSNLLINGNFDIWQRGSSFSTSSYTADRWYLTSYGANQAQRINGNIGLDNASNCIRLSTLSDGSYFSLTQPIATESVSLLRGQTVTLSYYARLPTSGNNNWTGPIYSEVFFSSDIDNIVNNKILITDSLFSGTMDATNYTWGFYSSSFTIPTNASTLAVTLRPSGYLSSEAKIDIAKVKLELGSTPTPISFDIYDHESYACKKYYQQVQATLKAGAGGSSSNKKNFGFSTTLPVKPRISNPSIKQGSNNSVALDTISLNIINDHYLNVIALSNSPNSELSTQLIIDSELPVGRPAAAVNHIDIIRNSGTINLDWNTPQYADENISDYVVLYGNSPNSLNQIATFIDSTGSLTGLSDSLPYYIKIKSISPYGESPLSNTFESAPLYTTPSGVGSLTGTWGFDRSYISWVVPENNGGSVITGYKIDRSMYSGFDTGIYTTAHFVPISPTSFNIAKFASELSTTGTYYFRVSAMNLAGTGTPTTLSLPKTISSPFTNIATSMWLY